jgi:hypothetical protein
VVSRHLPYLFDVAGLGLVPVMDAKRQPLVRRAPPGHRIQEPVGVRAVGTTHTQHSPGPGQDVVCSLDNPRREVRGDLGAD